MTLCVPTAEFCTLWSTGSPDIAKHLPPWPSLPQFLPPNLAKSTFNTFFIYLRWMQEVTDHQNTIIIFLRILTVVIESTPSLWPRLMALKRILGFESFSTIIASIIDSTRTQVVCLYVIPDIGGNLGLKITVTAAIHSIRILKDLWPKQVFEPCNHMPLWYLLLWRCQAFLDEQNLEQMGHV